MQHHQREPHIVAALPILNGVGLAHFVTHIVRYLLVQVSFGTAQLVGNGVGPPLGKQGPAIEREQVFFHHAAHEALGVRPVNALPVLAFESVSVQQRHERLEVFLLPGVWGGGHEQKVMGGFRQ